MRTLRTAITVLSLVLMSAAALAAPQVYKLHVEGLACRICAYGVELRLSEIEGVTALETDVRRGTVTVTMADGAELDEATARRAVEAAGFKLRTLELIGVARQIQPGK